MNMGILLKLIIIYCILSLKKQDIKSCLKIGEKEKAGGTM